MYKSKPAISVLIPTYNRAPFLKHTLETCVAQSYDNVEFIVHDDASDDNTEEMVANFTAIDSRIRYIKSPSNLGMRLNFEKGLAEVRGDYLICLGGDDALLPEKLTELAEIIWEHPSDVISWPTACFIYKSKPKGYSQLFAPHIMFNQPFLKRLSTADYLARQSKQLLYVSDHKSPMLYVKSCVPMSTVRVIQDGSGGIFFKSSTPDGYSGFAISSVKKSYIFTNRSFTMHGVSTNSAGLNYVGGNGGDQDLSQKFFRENVGVPMAPQLGSVPYSPLITLMTADFLYQTDLLFQHGFSAQISHRDIISRSLQELANGSFNEAKIGRELDILSNIARFVGETNYLEDQMRKVRRNASGALVGNALSLSTLYLDAERIKVTNVNEAACFIAQNRHDKHIYSYLPIVSAVLNSIRYRLKARRKFKRISNFLKSENN